MNIARYIDHTLLKPTSTTDDIKNLCIQATEYDFFAVCVPPPLVKQAAGYLAGSNTRTATVIGFPFGYNHAAAKLLEAHQAIADGADELDVVINLVLLKNGDWQNLEAEMRPIIDMIHRAGKLVKVIIESGVLTSEEIIKCCELYAKTGADFLKTSTGYAEKGATAEAVQLMRGHLPSAIHIKASGGIRNYEQARQMIDAGAGRLGCSAGIAIVNGEKENAGGY